jgi:NAD(P)-dependent dehydrogenase (short-subunit alcohol dehydrogenase family)
MHQQQQRECVWLITGCSTGLGRELAKLVLARGQRAVITARNADQIEDLVQGYPETALGIALDVRQPTQIHAAVAQAEERFGRVDVLVNNAGYGYLAAIEEGEPDQVRDIFETNVFGLVEMTSAVLPGMRKRKTGHIFNLSSIGGLMGFPATGYYHATKFAVEGLSESLAAELGPLGIHVTIVEPGPFRTDWAGRSLLESSKVIEDYAGTAGARRRSSRSISGKQPGDPARAAEAMFAVTKEEHPPLRLLLGRIALTMALGKLEKLKTEFEQWRATTESADFAEGE